MLCCYFLQKQAGDTTQSLQESILEYLAYNGQSEPALQVTTTVYMLMPFLFIFTFVTYPLSSSVPLLPMLILTLKSVCRV